MSASPRPREGLARRAVALVVLLLVASGCTGSDTRPASRATDDQVTVLPALHGRSTSVTLDPAAATSLAALGVTLRPTGSATATTGQGVTTVAFPITAGYAEVHSDHRTRPGWIDGSLSHDGSGLALTAGTATLQLDNLVVDPGGSRLYATVAGRPAVPVLALDGRRVTARVQGTTLVLDGTVARLTPAAAALLGDAFHTASLSAGMVLGTLHVAADATGAVSYPGTADVTALSRVSGSGTQLTVLTAALRPLGVSVTGTGAATTAGAVLTLPITGGFLAVHGEPGFRPGRFLGSVLHQGSGLVVHAGTAQLAMTDLVLDPGTSTVTGTVDGVAGVSLLTLDGSKVTLSKTGSDVVIDGAVLRLTVPDLGGLDPGGHLPAGLPIATVHIVAAQG